MKRFKFGDKVRTSWGGVAYVSNEEISNSGGYDYVLTYVDDDGYVENIGAWHAAEDLVLLGSASYDNL